MVCGSSKLKRPGELTGTGGYLQQNPSSTISCEPFFYGREGHRKLIRATSAGMITEQILEANAYERMFLRKRPEWLATQESRSEALCLVSDGLERLGRQAGML